MMLKLPQLLTAGRLLTANEITMAQSIFGEALNTATIFIYPRSWVFRGYGFSPNGHIYVNPHDYLADYACASLQMQAWLMHELTHVWQFQQGVNVLLRAICNRRYRYLLEAGKHYSAYGVEQQAQMVQDYYVKKNLGENCTALANCLPFVGMVRSSS